MMSSLKKMKDNIDKLELKTLYGINSKRRCPSCHRFTLFMRNKEGKTECIRCKNIIER